MEAALCIALWGVSTMLTGHSLPLFQQNPSQFNTGKPSKPRTTGNRCAADPRQSGSTLGVRDISTYIIEADATNSGGCLRRWEYSFALTANQLCEIDT